MVARIAAQAIIAIILPIKRASILARDIRRRDLRARGRAHAHAVRAVAVHARKLAELLEVVRQSLGRRAGRADGRRRRPRGGRGRRGRRRGGGGAGGGRGDVAHVADPGAPVRRVQVEVVGVGRLDVRRAAGVGADLVRVVAVGAQDGGEGVEAGEGFDEKKKRGQSSALSTFGGDDDPRARLG